MFKDGLLRDVMLKISFAVYLCYIVLSCTALCAGFCRVTFRYAVCKSKLCRTVQFVLVLYWGEVWRGVCCVVLRLRVYCLVVLGCGVVRCVVYSVVACGVVWCEL